MSVDISVALDIITLSAFVDEMGLLVKIRLPMMTNKSTPLPALIRAKTFRWRLIKDDILNINIFIIAYLRLIEKDR